MGSEPGLAMFSSAGEHSWVIGNFLLLNNFACLVNQLNFHKIRDIHSNAALEPEPSGHPEFIFIRNCPDLTEVRFRIGGCLFREFFSQHVPGCRTSGENHNGPENRHD